MRLAACGLNCGLCPRYYTEGGSQCPGCAGEDFFKKHPACGVLSCAKRRGVEFCYQCGEYPCKKYDTATLYDSFITHQTMMRNFERAKTAGLGSYQGELNEKMRILRHLLDDYDDGRRKSFFCLAVDLLALQDLKDVMEQILRRAAQDAPVKEKAALAAALLQETAQRREITLKLHKKTKA